MYQRFDEAKTENRAAKITSDCYVTDVAMVTNDSTVEINKLDTSI